MDLFLQIEQTCQSALHRNDIPAAKKALDELGVEIHSIQNAAKKMEAHQRLASIREKVRKGETKYNKDNVYQRDEESAPAFSKDDVHLVHQNRELQNAVIVGRSTENTATDAKVNLQHQSG